MIFFRFVLLGLLPALIACSAPTEKQVSRPGANIVTVIGAIHGQHRRSDSYSLPVLKAAIVNFNPDVILLELPPESFAKASVNYKAFGEVRESRADDFPELTDVVFPLQQKLGFEMIPVAAWTQKIAEDRRATLADLQKDSLRAKDWATYQAAIADYNRAVSGRSDDPLFIHSDAYDNAVKARQEVYQTSFGDDLGPGGWQNINAAHYRNVTATLDNIKGQEKRVLILYGAWHKYWFLAQLETRDDIQLIDAAELFSD